MTEPYEKVTMRKRHIIINNFLGGISWGLGATIGLGIVLTILGIILSKINLVPIVGNFISAVLESALKNNPHLLK